MRFALLKKRFVTAAAGVALAVTSVLALQVVMPQSASATTRAACISRDNGQFWNMTASTTNSKSPTWTTTVNCVDINFTVGATSGGHPQGRIRVCFVGAGYCQSSWKNLVWADTIVVASNVSDGTTFRMEIDWSGGYGTAFQTGTYA